MSYPGQAEGVVNRIMLYDYGMIFLYKSFFVNYILSFSLVGLWTIRLLVQVHRHWVQFTLARRRYFNHNCHNKPQIGNVTGVWMTSSPEAMGILKKTSVGSRLWASRVGFLLRSSPVGCRMGIGRVGSRLAPCRRTVQGGTIKLSP